jgi:hypothetical protein
MASSFMRWAGTDRAIAIDADFLPTRSCGRHGAAPAPGDPGFLHDAARCRAIIAEVRAAT